MFPNRKHWWLVALCVGITVSTVATTFSVIDNDNLTAAGRTYFIVLCAATFGLSVIWLFGDRLGNLFRVAITLLAIGAGVAGLLRVTIWEPPPNATVASTTLAGIHPAELSFTHVVTLDPRTCTMAGDLPNEYDVFPIISADGSRCVAIVDLQVAAVHVVADKNPDAAPIGAANPLDTYVVDLPRRGKEADLQVEFFLYYSRHLSRVQWMPTGYERAEFAPQRKTRGA